MGMAKKIDNIIYYSVALRVFEELDFRDDSLAGVRACYFESGCKIQEQETIQFFEQRKYDYCYKMEKDKPMLWKVLKDGELVQASKYLPDNMYCICYYNENQLPIKKVYFNQRHYWTKSEYFAPEKGADCVCSIAPKIINGYFALIKTVYSENGCIAVPMYMVTAAPKSEDCTAVAYSDKGMLYFTGEAPKDAEEDLNENTEGFTFAPVDFNLARNLNSTFDISYAPYLTAENGNPFSSGVELNNEIFSHSADYSADEEQSPEIEAEKDNENGNNSDKQTDYATDNETESITDIADNETESNGLNTSDSDFDKCENTLQTENDNSDSDFSNESEPLQQIDDDIPLPEKETDIPRSEKENDALVPDYDFSEDEDINIYHSKDFDSKREKFKLGKQPSADKSINDGNTRFFYYGSLDENGARNGYGRTETQRGRTAYEGQYKNDMRNGFGTFYYKDGSVNYIGDWKNNKRNGRGVGFRSSDGEIHVGKWIDNLPESMGARFDKNGNFISLNNFVKGNKDGIGISLDENGKLIVSKWSNNIEVDSKIIIFGDSNE